MCVSWCPGEGHPVCFRIKQSGPRSYLQIVENQRDSGAVRQTVIATLGRADELAASGGLAALLASGARRCEQLGGATPFAPRTVKDLIEEQLFAARRDLFSELSVVFMDTTSLSFVGAGGASLGERGYSKDHRPDLMQMILGVVIDADGRPVCSEMWPGNTADVGVLVPVIDRLRSRFGIGRVCVVADRGMISAATITALEERGP